MTLFLLAGGDAFWIGAGFIACGAALGLLRPRVGRVCVIIGALLIGVSAAPLQIGYYAALFVAVAFWITGTSRRLWVRVGVTVMLLVACALVTSVLVVESPSAPGSHQDTRPIFVLGDSLSAGLAGGSETTWPQVLGNQVRRPVTSLARPGARLLDGIRQADALPAIGCTVLIELGGNDLLGGATAERFGEDLHLLLRKVATPGRSVLMFELPLLPLQNSYGWIQRQAAGEFGVRLIARRVLAGAVILSGNTSDGLHLSPLGHLWLANRVAPWL